MDIVKSKYTLFALQIMLLTQLCGYGSILIAQESSLADKQDSTCILKANYTEWRPYQYFDEDGQPAGMQVELLNQIANLAGCQLQFERRSFNQTIDEIADGKLDMGINATVTDDRKNFVYFSAPYRNEIFTLYSTGLYVESCRLNDLETLIGSGFRLGLQKQSYYGKQMQEIQNSSTLNKNIYYFENISQHFQLIKKDRIDGIIDDPMIVAYRLRKDKMGPLLHSCHKIITSNPVSLMFSKKTVSKDIVNRFNNAIKKIKASKYYRQTWGWK